MPGRGFILLFLLLGVLFYHVEVKAHGKILQNKNLSSGYIVLSGVMFLNSMMILFQHKTVFYI